MSQKINRRDFTKLVAGCVAASLFDLPARAEDGAVRFAWTNTGCVSSPTAHALMRTDIPAANGLKVDMKQLNTAPAVAEALISGWADIGSMSDFTCLAPMAIGAPLKVVAKQSTFRTSILATQKSPIRTLADLKGKAVYGVFGVTAYQTAQEAVLAAGLKPGRDVTFINMGVAELADAVRAQHIDAFFTWDPWVAFFEQAGYARILSQNITAANLLVARSDFIDRHYDGLTKFLRAHHQAQYFCSQNHHLVNDWFRSLDPARGIPESVIDTASQFNPDWSARSLGAIKLTLTPERITDMKALAVWGHDAGLLPKVPDVEKGIDNRAAPLIDAQASTSPFNVANVKVL